MLRRAHPGFEWVEEASFRDDLLGVLGSEPFLVFHTDDDVFFGEVPEFELGDDEVCFSLRLGLNITYSYTLDTDEQLEQSDVRGDRMSWAWRQQKLGAFSYPLALNGHVFRTAEARDWLTRVDYTNPNELESALQHSRTRSGRDGFVHSQPGRQHPSEHRQRHVPQPPERPLRTKRPE